VVVFYTIFPVIIPIKKIHKVESFCIIMLIIKG
jgi:hypothetical protein